MDTRVPSAPASQMRQNVVWLAPAAHTKGVAPQLESLLTLDRTDLRMVVEHAPYLVYVLAYTRQDRYVIGALPDMPAIGATRGRLGSLQPSAHRVWPSLIWLQSMSGRSEAEAYAGMLGRWSHDWQRRLIEQRNPQWRSLDDVLQGVPEHERRPLPEKLQAPDAAMARSRAESETASARRAIASLPSYREWSGELPDRWWQRLRAAPWGVVVYAWAQHGSLYRIEAVPAHVPEEIFRRVIGYNRARKQAWDKLPPWRWVWFEPQACEADAHARQAGLQRWPQAWQRALVTSDNPDWYGIDKLLTDTRVSDLKESAFLSAGVRCPTGLREA